MGKKKDHSLTPSELEIMSVLWEVGPANVQTVQQKLKRELAYTTVQTMLNILHRKGKVKRTLENRTYIYKPVVSRRQVVSHIVGDLVDRLFGGSAESLVMSLLETKHLTPERLVKLNKLLKAPKKMREADIDDDWKSCAELCGECIVAGGAGDSSSRFRYMAAITQGLRAVPASRMGNGSRPECVVTAMEFATPYTSNPAEGISNAHSRCPNNRSPKCFEIV